MFIARKLIAATAALGAVLTIVTPSAGATPFTFRAEVAQPDLFHGLVDRTTTMLDPAGATVPVVGGTCAPDSVIGAVASLLAPSQWAAVRDAGSGVTSLTRVKGFPLDSYTPSPGAAPPAWVAYVGWVRQADLCASLANRLPGQEILVYLKCGTQISSFANPCFGGEPLGIRAIGGVGDSTITQGSISVAVSRGSTNAPNAHVISDEGVDVLTDPIHKDGTADVPLTAGGGHIIVATESTGSVLHVPDRVHICRTDGHDGFCGTAKVVQTPFDVGQFPSDCATNGHDGFCGTADMSGPAAHITNIRDTQIFQKGLGRITGKIDPPDPNGTKGVQLRLTRTWTTRIRVHVKSKKANKRAVGAKVKKKPAVRRYRTVKRCAVWDDRTALIETATCGSKTAQGKFFDADLSDLRLDFTYSFALTLPVGVYKLEVVAQDQNGYKDAPAPGRNIITFSVQR